MKKALLLVAGLAACAALRAEDAPKSSFSVTADIPYTTNYVFRGQEYAKDSLQPSVEVTYTDFYAGVWSNQPFKKGADAEYDFYAGYKYTLNDLWNVDVGLTDYFYPETANYPGFHRSTLEGYLGVNGNVKGFTPGLYLYRDFNLNATTCQGHVGYSIPFARTGVSVDFTANLGRVMPDQGSSYTYWTFGANVPVKINDKATFYAGLSYNNHTVKTLTRDIVAFTAGVTFAF